MKKLLTTLGLLAAVTFSLPAGAIWLLGGSMGYTNQATAANHPWSATSLGIMEQSYFDVSETLGVYTAATLGFMAGSQDNGTALDVGKYQGIALNVLLGLGYRLPLTPWLSAIGGAGMYLGSTTLAAADQTLSSYYGGGLGAGVGVSLMYALSLNWGIGVNVNAAWFFANPGDRGATMSASGVSLFGGIGVTWFATPDLEVPRYSRFSTGTTRQ
jgi:hypothetical protein